MIKIYGSSDDIVCVDGAIEAEFGYHSDELDYVALSNGMVFSIEYTQNGLWRINLVLGDKEKYSKEEATDPDSDEYSDIVTINENIEWVVGGQIARKKK